jgi:endonuclease YncB( thermonuclease family)
MKWGVTVSLNHKRRIFRAGVGSAALRSVTVPSVGMLAIVAGAATLLVAISLFIRSSDAPARAPAAGHISAAATDLAVLDGETLRIGEHVVRLEGIAAPPRGSVCHDAGNTEIDCGSAAANALSSLVRGSIVDCTIRRGDGQGRATGDCVAAGKPLGATLVQAGWAKAQAADLRAPEAAARAAGRGMWRSGS